MDLLGALADSASEIGALGTQGSAFVTFFGQADLIAIFWQHTYDQPDGHCHFLDLLKVAPEQVADSELFRGSSTCCVGNA